MAVSPNNAAFLINLEMPIVSFVVCVKQINEKNTSNMTSVFHVNILTQESSKCELMTKLLNSLQSISYLEHMSDLNSKPDPELAKIYKEIHNQTCAGLRKKYLSNLEESIV